MEWLALLFALVVAFLAVMVLRLESAMRGMEERLAHTHHVAHTALELLHAHVEGLPIKIISIPLRKDDKE